jgi:cytochrome P450 family 6
MFFRCIKSIKKSLRKYPSVGGLVQITFKDYTLPNSDFTSLPNAMMNSVPTQGFQRNQDFFLNPEVFDPERFDSEQAARNPFTNLPFSEGPRNCIGLRFGMMQAQIGLAMLLKSLRFEISCKSESSDFECLWWHLVQREQGVSSHGLEKLIL